MWKTGSRQLGFLQLSIIVYNIHTMKFMKKAFLLFATLGLSICSCSLEKRCECLETSDSLTYNEGMCYQASRSNVVESVFVMNRPLNPEDAPENYKYDISWNDTIRIDNFSMVDGLSGKHIMTILKMNDHILKITFDGAVSDTNATYGYIRILPNAFKAYSDRATDSVLYAYISIGNGKCLAEKPNS